MFVEWEGRQSWGEGKEGVKRSVVAKRFRKKEDEQVKHGIYGQ